MSYSRKKICVVVTSRANYSSIKSVLLAIRAHEKLELQIVATASAMLDRYGSVIQIMERDGFTIDEQVFMSLEGETPETMAQSTGLGLIKLPSVFSRLKPDCVLTIGDRFETMATAVAAVYMNIPLAHTMGGEVTGTVDESVRHAVTKLAHIHFPANEDAGNRIAKMGESAENIHVVGCPRIDLATEVIKNGCPELEDFLKKEGVGGEAVDINKPFLLFAQYPVTTEYGHGEQQINNSLEAIGALNMPTIVLWPNSDAGSENVSRGIRKFRENGNEELIRFYKNFPPEYFMFLISKAACMLGNSSAAIREGAFLGVPAVNIGSRQDGRARGKNILDVGYNSNEILEAIKTQLNHGAYESDELYGDGMSGKRVAQVLSETEVAIQKQITY